jgi:hypothetical protein
MSSKTLNFVFKFLGSTLEGKRFDLNKKFVDQLPIHLSSPEEQQIFIDKADQMLKLNQELQDEVKGFHNWLKTTFSIDKLSKKLENTMN